MTRKLKSDDSHCSRLRLLLIVKRLRRGKGRIANKFATKFSSCIIKWEWSFLHENSVKIPDATTSSQPVRVTGMEYISDAYEVILQAERDGLILVRRYADMSDKMREWNIRTIREEYDSAGDHPEYRHFLLGRFPDILNGYAGNEGKRL